MPFNKWTRRAFVITGALLAVLAAAAWVAPVVIAKEAAVSRTVEIKKGLETTTETTLGWGSLHSSQVVALFGAGIFLLVLGSLPPGSVRSMRTAFGGVEFSTDSLAQIAGVAATEVSGNAIDEAKVRDLFIEALAKLQNVADVQSGATLRPSRDQIEKAVSDASKRDGDFGD